MNNYEASLKLKSKAMEDFSLPIKENTEPTISTKLNKIEDHVEECAKAVLTIDEKVKALQSSSRVFEGRIDNVKREMKENEQAHSRKLDVIENAITRLVDKVEWRLDGHGADCGCETCAEDAYYMSKM